MDNLPIKTYSTLTEVDGRFDFECRPYGERIFLGDIFFDNRELTVDILKRIEKQKTVRTYIVCSENVGRMINALSRIESIGDIWAGTYARTQDEADRLVPILVSGMIKVRKFIICAPILEKVVIYRWLNKYKKSLVKENDFNGISWVVAGGDDNVLMKKEWLLDIFVQCASANVALYFKGWGAAERSGDELPTDKERELFERIKFLSHEYAKDFKYYYGKYLNRNRGPYGKRYIKKVGGVSSPKK